MFQADQICYAVLCVFSYFAAGQEQKKAILEQAARVPPSPSPSASPSPARAHPPPSPTAAKHSPQVTKEAKEKESYLFHM